MLWFRCALGAAGLATALTPTVAAEVPTYSQVQLQARSGGSGAFNLPLGSAFVNGTPAINDEARVAFRLVTVGTTGRAGLWVGGDGSGGVVYTSPTDVPVISDPNLNASGAAVAEEFSFASSTGVLRYDPKSGGVSVAVPPGPPIGVTSFGAAQIADDGRIGFRGTIAGNQVFVVANGPQQTIYAGVPAIVPGSPWDFLFTPSLDNLGRIGGKVRRIAGGNEIRVFSADGGSLPIARDAAAEPGSPYASLDNSVSLADSGFVAFIAGLVGGGRGVFLSDGTTTRTIATTALPEVSEIEFFAPSANASGLVAFRGRDAAGLRSIFVGDGTTLRRVIGNFDPVPTDLGPAQIARPDASPVFGGNVRINARGDIAFSASVTPASSTAVSWGSGIFVIYADEAPANPCDFNGDGVVDGADLAVLLGAWGPCKGCPEDLTGDGVVNGADLAVLLAKWG